MKSIVKCITCEGKGNVPNPDPYQGKYPGSVTVYCRRCDGRGYIKEDIVTAIDQLANRLKSIEDKLEELWITQHMI